MSNMYPHANFQSETFDSRKKRKNRRNAAMQHSGDLKAPLQRNGSDAMWKSYAPKEHKLFFYLGNATL